MYENISRPSGAKPPPIGRGLAGKPSSLKKLRKESTVALWGFEVRNTTSPNLVTFVVPPPERTISSSSFTIPSWHNPLFSAEGVRLGKSFTQQIDPRMTDTRILDARGSEEYLHDSVLWFPR
jgi:hypothetical protein